MRLLLVDWDVGYQQCFMTRAPYWIEYPTTIEMILYLIILLYVTLSGTLLSHDEYLSPLPVLEGSTGQQQISCYLKD